MEGTSFFLALLENYKIFENCLKIANVKYVAGKIEDNLFRPFENF